MLLRCSRWTSILLLLPSPELFPSVHPLKSMACKCERVFFSAELSAARYMMHKLLYLTSFCCFHTLLCAPSNGFTSSFFFFLSPSFPFIKRVSVSTICAVRFSLQFAECEVNDNCFTVYMKLKSLYSIWIGVVLGDVAVQASASSVIRFLHLVSHLQYVHGM